MWWIIPNQTWRQERQGDLGIGLWHEVLFHTCFLKSDVFHYFHDFHEFHDFMISWYMNHMTHDMNTILTIIYICIHTNVMRCGVLCVATMSRPGPWLRFGRDAGAGAKLSPVSPWFSGVWNAFLPLDLWDLKGVKTINRCMPYMCHICAMYTYTMSIYDHMRWHDVFFASDA